jgi:hypothetical protein
MAVNAAWANAGTSSRAGFTLRNGQWKMTYFVEGD